MTRRSKGGDHRPDGGLDDLITQLEAGSRAAENRLAALAAQAPSGENELIDRIASSAAAGSPYSLELLLSFVVDHRLAGPAIGRVVQRPSIAEDIEQEVLVAVARSIHRFRADAKFTTWLYALARNVAVSHMRRLRPTVEIGPDEILHHGSERRMSSLVTERDVVREAIDSLPLKFRSAVLLRDIEGCSYAEIGERLGLELNTVRSRLARGRALLAVRLP